MHTMVIAMYKDSYIQFDLVLQNFICYLRQLGKKDYTDFNRS